MIPVCCGNNDEAGSIIVFLGAEINYSNVLAYVDGRFLTSSTATFTISKEGVVPYSAPTSSPTQSPSAESRSPTLSPIQSQQQNVTVLINFDTYSAVSIDWYILNLDTGRIVYSVGRGSYSLLDGDMITEVVSLNLDGDYTFEMYDVGGNGICCDQGEGFIEIYFGTELRADRLLMFDRGNFTSATFQNFTVSLDNTITVTSSPSTTPTASISPTTSAAPSAPMVDIVVQIHLDRYVVVLHASRRFRVYRCFCL